MRKYSGVIQEIIEHYPNVDVVGLLEDELRIPRFKAEELAQRIQIKFLSPKTGQIQQKTERIFEKSAESNLSPIDGAYAVDCLCTKEFERFICWLLGEYGFQVESVDPVEFGVNLVALKAAEKTAIQAIRCPKNLSISAPIVLTSQQAQCIYGCARSIVVATGYFSPKAVEEAQKQGVELWNRDVLFEKISEVKRKAGVEVQVRFPPYEGSLLASLLRLEETKDFLIESKAGDKFDVYLPGVKYPLLTFQACSGIVVRCVRRIKYNEPVAELEGEAIVCGNGVNPNDIQAYGLVIQYLEQFLE